MRTLKTLLYWTLLVFGIFATLFVLPFTGRAEAEQKKEQKKECSNCVRCPVLTGDIAQCETHGVTQWTPHWETRLGNRVAQHTKGIKVFITVDEKWREIHIYIIQRDKTMELFNGYIRIQEGEVVFGKQDGDGG